MNEDAKRKLTPPGACTASREPFCGKGEETDDCAELAAVAAGTSLADARREGAPGCCAACAAKRLGFARKLSSVADASALWPAKSACEVFWGVDCRGPWVSIPRATLTQAGPRTQVDSRPYHWRPRCPCRWPCSFAENESPARGKY
jgi:hypothetical protein